MNFSKTIDLLIIGPLFSWLFSLAIVDGRLDSSVALGVDGDETYTRTENSSSLSPDPGTLEATQAYGSPLATAVMVTDLFLVPSVLFSSAEVKGATFVDPSRKCRSILG